jgi:Glyoxalase/Bleomycin resistance protein/Dioxygenase superfamily
MVAIQGVAHFSIPVSDVAKSTRFYTEVVGCRHLETVRRGEMAFLDAAGTCLILRSIRCSTTMAACTTRLSWHMTTTRRPSITCVPTASRSPLKRTGKAVWSMARAPIFMILTGQCWNSSI